MITHPPLELIIDLPDGSSKTVRIKHTGARLSDILRGHGVPLNTRCGGRGLCESCNVELASGALDHTVSGEHYSANGEAVTVKACHVRLPENAGVTHVRVPARSYLKYQPQIVTDYRVNIACGHDPLYTPAAGESPLGVAIDIGTTTVALLLVDLTNGEVLARGAMFNQQMNLGDDVVTRIQLCTDKAMITRLQHAVADETIRPLLEAALAHAAAKTGGTGGGDPLSRVKCFAVAANTTMLHLLAGEDPTSLGFAPFTAQFLEHKIVPAGKVFGNLKLPAGCEVHLLPSAAAYVGADLTAGVVASGMLYDDGPSLLVDVGTNGEIILKHQGKFFGCATAAGPAFEGAGLSCGMRAGDGTIAYVHMKVSDGTFRVDTHTIGDEEGKPHTPPVGICGSAYIDFLAEARRVGLLTPTGGFEADFNAHGRIAFYDPHHGDGFRLAFAPGKQPIVVTRRDIAGLLQAKSAVAAGILTLMERVGLAPPDIKTVYLAGGFGTKMRSQNAIDCGLLPGFAAKQIQPVGNTALAGAYLALLDRSLLDEMKTVGSQMDVVELNLDPSFEDRYIEQLSLP